MYGWPYFLSPIAALIAIIIVKMVIRAKQPQQPPSSLPRKVRLQAMAKRWLGLFVLMFVVPAILMFFVLGGIFGLFTPVRQTDFFNYTPSFGGNIALLGLTDKGAQQSVIVVPVKIQETYVGSLGFPQKRLFVRNAPGHWESGALQKVFLQGSIHINTSVFARCTALEKVILTTPPSFAFTQNSKLAEDENGSIVRHIYIANAWCKAEYAEKEHLRPANVTFLLGYNDRPEHDVHWIDDIAYGSKIEQLPPKPVREGYEFGGWHKDSECAVLWNFDSDTVFSPEGEYHENILYAKWTDKL